MSLPSVDLKAAEAKAVATIRSCWHPGGHRGSPAAFAAVELARDNLRIIDDYYELLKRIKRIRPKPRARLAFMGGLSLPQAIEPEEADKDHELPYVILMGRSPLVSVDLLWRQPDGRPIKADDPPHKHGWLSAAIEDDALAPVNGEPLHVKLDGCAILRVSLRIPAQDFLFTPPGHQGLALGKMPKGFRRDFTPGHPMLPKCEVALTL